MDVSNFEDPYIESYISFNSDRDELDIFCRAIVDRNPMAIEIILRNLDKSYDFFKEKENDRFLKFSVLGLAKNCGSEEVKNIVYNAASLKIENSYDLYSRLVELYDEYEDFVSFVIRKRNDGFYGSDYDANQDDLVKDSLKNGDVQILKLILDNGLDASKINLLEVIAKKKGFKKEIPYENKKETVELLLGKGADINILPLYESYERFEIFTDFDDIDFLNLMLEHGMPVDIVKEECLFKMLDYYSDFEADEKGVYAVSLLIKAGANVNYIGKSSGDSVLYKACWKDKKDGKLVRLLLENGATTKLKFRQRINSCIPVNEALWCGNYEAIKALKEYGLKLKGTRIMTHAATSPSDSVECMKFVLAENKNVNKRDLFGRSAFWWAAWRGNAKIMKFLKEQGANINVRSYFKRKTGSMEYLEDIINYGNLFQLHEIMGAIDCGIDLSLTDRKGKTLRDYAILVTGNMSDEKKRAEARQMIEAIDRKLSENGKPVELSIYDAVILGNDNLLVKLLKNPEVKSNINKLDINGLSPMEYATRSNNYKAIGILLKNGSAYTKQMITNTIDNLDIEKARAFFSNGVSINISLTNDDFVNDAPDFTEMPIAYALNRYNMEYSFLLAMFDLKPNLSNEVFFKSNNKFKAHWVLHKIIDSYFGKDEKKNEVLIAAIKAGADPYHNDYKFFKEYFESRNDFKDEFFRNFLELEKDATEKLYKDGLFLGVSDDNGKYVSYEKIVQEKLLVGKVMTVKENLNIRGYVEDEYDVHEEVICTLKPGTRLRVTGVMYKREEIDGMNKFWVEVELTKDAVSTSGNLIEAGTKGHCYSGYLE